MSRWNPGAILYQLVNGVVTAVDLATRQNRFASLLKFEAMPGQTLLRDPGAGAGTPFYHGRAADGTLTSAASWEVVRFVQTGTEVTEVRYRTGVAWDDRALGW